MEIDKFVAEIFQDRQCGWRTVDELARAGAGRETSFDDEIVLARFDSSFEKLRVQFLQVLSAENCLDCAQVGPGANQRFVGALAEQELQRPDDDRFARAGFSGDSNEARPELPLEFFHEREILDSQQSEDGRHWGG